MNPDQNPLSPAPPTDPVQPPTGPSPFSSGPTPYEAPSPPSTMPPGPSTPPATPFSTAPAPPAPTPMLPTGPPAPMPLNPPGPTPPTSPFPPKNEFTDLDQASQAHHGSTAVQVVWQWLTYALWSWTLCALSILLSGILAFFFVEKNASYDFLIYTMATLLVLLPLAFFSDKYYRKMEPDQKHGFPAVVMVLNAVVIFLVALGGLITAVISLFTMILGSGGSNSVKLITFLSSTVVALLGMMLFLRIIRPPKLKNLISKFPLIVVIISGLAIILTIAGPFVHEVSRKSDKLIESGLPSVNTAVQDYASKNKKLPQNLSDLTPYNEDGKKLISQNKVEYKVVQQPIATTTTSGTTYTTTYTDATAKYELCVTYKADRKPSSSYSAYSSYDNETSYYIDTGNHGAGRQCYTKTVKIYNYND